MPKERQYAVVEREWKEKESDESKHKHNTTYQLLFKTTAEKALGTITISKLKPNGDRELPETWFVRANGSGFDHRPILADAASATTMPQLKNNDNGMLHNTMLAIETGTVVYLEREHHYAVAVSSWGADPNIPKFAYPMTIVELGAGSKKYETPGDVNLRRIIPGQAKQLGGLERWTVRKDGMGMDGQPLLRLTTIHMDLDNVEYSFSKPAE